VIRGPLRHPVPVLAIRKARPQDGTILGHVDAATWTANASPAPAPPVGTAFFSERTRPDDVLVAEVEGCRRLREAQSVDCAPVARSYAETQRAGS